MASALRPAILRHALGAPASTRALTTSALPAFRAHHLAQRSPLALQRATFQTSTKRAILPALPQVIRGTVNDPVTVRDADPTHGSYHWTFERILSAGLIPITLAPFAAGSLSPVLDGALIGMIIVHSYIGFESIITDYLPKWRVPITRRILEWGNVLAVFVVGWGYYEFETNDVGLTEGIKRIWRAGSSSSSSSSSSSLTS
ncbi:hypothetical protein BAUCODRAFT_64927 [Baudoinia panamericana UAMH 10762]|uniref:Succinate dehydrogenase [ubiquinone] cytochrome b small subunit n=1 Tax=Baudoinia panamericana (strain UAMH 10762) TaxID=717646 RepID=M2NIM5_BAUPA|nr:uncharacterized protein BAUCODRAFT_64927 [Baudoinia panamericana UAMH 10762]EMC98945.1 hypothetical protein BAUCODRAFT_64927 [Baudoinia panamericana UAMH 10762]